MCFQLLGTLFSLTCEPNILHTHRTPFNRAHTILDKSANPHETPTNSLRSLACACVRTCAGIDPNYTWLLHVLPHSCCCRLASPCKHLRSVGPPPPPPRCRCFIRMETIECCARALVHEQYSLLSRASSTHTHTHIMYAYIRVDWRTRMHARRMCVKYSIAAGSCANKCAHSRPPSSRGAAPAT